MRVFRKLLALACTAALFSPEATAAPFNSATLRRIIDGREAVTFLVRVKECVENPERILFDV